MAVQSGLPFGQRVMWTYGPLGFLSFPALWEVSLAQMAVAYTVMLLTALPDYILNSVRISLGYGPALSLETPGLGWQYVAAFIALGLGVWAAWQMGVGMEVRQRRGITLLWVAFWFFAFKECQGPIRIPTGGQVIPHVLVCVGFGWVPGCLGAWRLPRPSWNFGDGDPGVIVTQ